MLCKYKLFFIDNQRTSPRRNNFNPIRFGFGDKITKSGEEIDLKNNIIFMKNK